jgi:cytoskeletal protein CcmA (bactofilin family)
MNKGTLGAAVGVAILVGIVAVGFTLFQGARESAALRADMTQQLGTKATSAALATQASDTDQKLKDKVSRSGDAAFSITATDLVVPNTFNASAAGDSVAVTGRLAAGTSSKEFFIVDKSGVWASKLEVSRDADVGNLLAAGTVTGDALQNSGGTFFVGKDGYAKAAGLVADQYVRVSGSPFSFDMSKAGLLVTYGPDSTKNLNFGLNRKASDKVAYPVVLSVPVIRADTYIALNTQLNFDADVAFRKSVSVNGPLTVLGAITGPGDFSVDASGVSTTGTIEAAAGDFSVDALGNITGTSLAAGSASVSGAVNAGSADVTNALTVGTAIDGPGGFTVDASGVSTKGTIDAAAGDFSVDALGNITGTSLAVDGSVVASALSANSLSVATVVAATSVQTPLLLSGAAGHIDAAALNVQGDFSVEGSTPGAVFSVARASGNTAIAGNLAVAKDLHVAQDLYVDGAVFGNTSASALTIKHTLKVDRIAPEATDSVRIDADNLVFYGTGSGSTFVVNSANTTLNGTLVVNGDVSVGAGHAFNFGNGAGSVTIAAGDTSAQSGSVGFTIGTVVASPSEETTGWWVTHSSDSVTVHLADAPASGKTFSFIAVK